MNDLQLHPAMPADPPPAGTPPYPRSIWIGSVDLEQLQGDLDIELVDGHRFDLARLLVWQGGVVRGFVEVPVHDARVHGSELELAAKELPEPDVPTTTSPAAPISVIVSTRDRPDDLTRCLTPLLDLAYPDFEVIVVDSASRTDEPRRVVEGLGSAAVRYVRLDDPGLSRARNAGVDAARHELLAFTDDDTIVDRRWLSALNEGFASGPDVGCVTGLVASGQLESDSQHYFDRRVTWARNLHRTAFHLDAPPADVPLFPFQFGAYGTGANFAVRRSLIDELGGFDTALGAGSLAGAGEDTDVFIRAILQRHALVYEPNAVVWHRHRRDNAALVHQLEGYGVGIGAVITKLLLDPVARRAMRPLIARGTAHAFKMVRVSDGDTKLAPGPGYAFKELSGILRGPIALHRARRAEAELAAR